MNQSVVIIGMRRREDGFGIVVSGKVVIKVDYRAHSSFLSERCRNEEGIASFLSRVTRGG